MFSEIEAAASVAAASRAARAGTEPDSGAGRRLGSRLLEEVVMGLVSRVNILMIRVPLS